MPDLLDVQLVYALQIDGRAPFSLIGEGLGVSDPTLLGLRSWIIRVQCTPSAAAAVAEALAQRPDTAWISLTSGGTEVTCVARTRTGDEDSHLLLDTLPRRAGGP